MIPAQVGRPDQVAPCVAELNVEVLAVCVKVPTLFRAERSQSEIAKPDGWLPRIAEFSHESSGLLT